MNAVAVAQPVTGARDVPVPDVAVALLELVDRCAAIVVEKRDLDGIGDAAEHRKGDSVPFRTGPEAGADHAPLRALEMRTIMSATSPVHPVWCDAPSPAPVSPSKYSWKSSASRHVASR